MFEYTKMGPAAVHCAVNRSRVAFINSIAPGNEESRGKSARGHQTADALLPGLGVVHVAFRFSFLPET